jgi:streptogrisin D
MRRLVAVVSLLLALLAVPVAAQASPSLAGSIAGGDPIYPRGGARCSVGFNARDAARVLYFLTSGHCAGPVGSAVTSGSITLGVVVAVTPARDFALVRYTDTTLSKPSAVRLPGGGLTPITAFGTAYAGQTVQRVGTTTGLRSGRVTALNATVTYAEGTVTGLIRTTVCAEPGDSGGPLFAGTVGLGVISGGSGTCASGGVTYVAPVTPLVAVWGLGAY